MGQRGQQKRCEAIVTGTSTIIVSNVELDGISPAVTTFGLVDFHVDLGRIREASILTNESIQFSILILRMCS